VVPFLTAKMFVLAAALVPFLTAISSLPANLFVNMLGGVLRYTLNGRRDYGFFFLADGGAGRTVAPQLHNHLCKCCADHDQNEHRSESYQGHDLERDSQ